LVKAYCEASLQHFYKIPSEVVTTHHGLVVVRQWDTEDVDHGGCWTLDAVKLSNVKSAFEPESAVIAVGI
jgi:hypothetical protein